MASYTAVYDDGVLRVTRTGNPPHLAIAGDIDESTYSGLVGTLREFAEGRGELHVDLAGVEYCDLAGLRAIVDLAGSGGRNRHVILHAVPPQLKTALSILGWDSTPGLAIDEPESAIPPRSGSLADAGEQDSGGR